MKKLLFTCMLLFATLWTYAQTENYYEGRDTVRGKDATYLCFKRGGGSYKFYRLVNIDNSKRLNEFLKLPDGRTAPPDAHVEYKLNDPDKAITRKIISETFTPGKVAALKNAGLEILVSCVVELDGRISEVDFFITENPLLYSIGPDTFYVLEQKIKKELTYTLDDRSKNNYQYALADMFINFKNMNL